MNLREQRKESGKKEWSLKGGRRMQAIPSSSLNNSSNRARTSIIALSLALLVGSALLLWRYVGDNADRAQRQHAQAVASAFRDLGKLGMVSEANIPETVSPQTFALLL